MLEDVRGLEEISLRYLGYAECDIIEQSTAYRWVCYTAVLDLSSETHSS